MTAPKTINHLFRAKIALILAVILWSSAFVGIRGLANVYTPGALGLMRYLIAAILMTCLYCGIRDRSTYRWRDRLWAMFLGALGFGIYSYCLNEGERAVTAGVASFIIGVTPIVMLILAKFLYGERLQRLGKIGFWVSGVGVIFIGVDGFQSAALGKGILFVFAAMLLAAVYNSFQKKLLVKMNSREFTTYAMWGGAISLLIFVPQLWSNLHTATWQQTSLAVYLGVFPAALAYLLASYAYSHLPTCQAGSYGYWIPIFSTAMAFLFLGEVPNLLAFIGGLIALFGAVMVTRSRMVVQPTALK